MGSRPNPLAYSFRDLDALKQDGFDAIIDVRSPSEFAEDHVPGAISMPVLSDAERSKVGTIYRQDSPFRARKIGAALVARNAARHIETQLADTPGGWRPLVYCWRGGQRSGSFASILTQIGWRAAVLEGGYRSWRRHVVARLYDAPLPFGILRLDGMTGTAKTDVLRRARELGAQVLDLEGLANHRGSVLGDVDGAQPSQKAFESGMVSVLSGFQADKPVLVEAESARIGALRIPPSLWAAMKGSPRIGVQADMAGRARYLAMQYVEMARDLPALAARLDKLRPLVGHAKVDGWLGMAHAGDLVDLARALIQDHYDPAYDRARSAETGAVIAHLKLGGVSDGELDQAAQKLVSLAARAPAFAEGTPALARE